MKYEKLSRDDPEKTVLMAGHTKMSIAQLENEIKTDSEIGKKLKQVEDILERDY